MAQRRPRVERPVRPVLCWLIWGRVQLRMKTAFLHTLLPSLVLLAAAPMPVLAQNDPPIEVTLDMDKDGRMDRAALVRHPDHAQADLYIYLAAGDEKLDLSRKPTFLKKDLTAEGILSLESKGEGSLVFTYGCGGCSNDYGTSLTIVHRGGKFLVAGFTYAWDTRTGMGSCDINFLTGKGVITRGLDGAGKRIKGKFTPVLLADWSDDKRPKACDL